MRFGAVRRVQSRLDDADKALAEGVGELAALRKAGDTTEATTIGLATGISAQALAARGRNQVPLALDRAHEAVATIVPLLDAPSPSLSARRAAADALLVLGVLQGSFDSADAGIRTLGRARDLYRGITGPDLADTPAAVAYAEASAWQSSAYYQDNRLDDSIRIGKEAVDTATRVLQSHPGYVSALRARGLAANQLADAYVDELMPSPGLAASEQSISDYEAIVAIDASNSIAWNNFGVAHATAAAALTRLGRVDEARSHLHAALDIEQRTRVAANIALMLTDVAGQLAALEAQQDERAAAQAALARLRRYLAVSLDGLPRNSLPYGMVTANATAKVAAVARILGEPRQAREVAQSSIDVLAQVQVKPGIQADTLDSAVATSNEALAWAAYRMGDVDAAGRAVDAAQAIRQRVSPTIQDLARSANAANLDAALIDAKRGRDVEARRLAQAVLTDEREAASRNRGDAQRSIDLARAWYVAGVSGAMARGAALDEASTPLRRLPPTLARWRDVQKLRDDIAAARDGPS